MPFPLLSLPRHAFPSVPGTKRAPIYVLVDHILQSMVLITRETPASTASDCDGTGGEDIEATLASLGRLI